MLPSMPILFTRDSQDAFGNKIEPSTSFFNQNPFEKPLIIKEPERPPPVPTPSTSSVTDNKGNADDKSKEQGTEDKLKENPLETALVRSFYAKIQSRFSSHSNLPTNKFVQFQSILKSFDPNKETPVDLFNKIEELFGEDHNDIVEDFLLFLKPGQAAQVGRFMDYLMLVQLTGFIEMLQTTFARKPNVLRKVLRSITTGINSGNSDDMRNRVLPHLRSNPRLTKMFKSLFPDERPPDNVYETGTDIINESFLTCDKGYDEWEFEEASDNKRNLEAKEGLDTTYLHGRVFLQHGRMLRSARVTYPYSKEPYRVHARRLAPNHCHPSPPASDDDRASPKRQNKINPKIPNKKAKKRLKSPLKNAKDVNDNTNCVVNSPKITKKQTNTKAKTCKEKKEDNKETNKKDKKADIKTQNNKKDDGNKVKQPQINNKIENNGNTESKDIIANGDKKPEAPGNWTRDEDKTMLQVLKGEPGSEQIFCKISELLPHRSVTEIKERFCHVMSLLQQMAVGEVT